MNNRDYKIVCTIFSIIGSILVLGGSYLAYKLYNADTSDMTCRS